MKKICVLIPCLNEALTVGHVIKNFKKQIPSCKVFVYDNGSSDDTIAVAKKNGAEVVLVEDKGKGNVVRRMFSHQHHGDYFIMIDGDGTYDISRIKDMLKLIENNQLDMVVGSRKHLDSKAYRRGHIIGNFFFAKIVSIIFGNKIQDLFSGFRIFSRRFIKTFPLHSSGFEIEAELTIHALEQKLPVGEIDCKYNVRLQGSNSKLKTFSDGIKILKLILVLVKDEKPLFFFLLLAIIFLILSLLLGIPIIFQFYETKLVEKLPSAVLSGFLMVLAFLSFFSGLILDVVKKIRYENKRLKYLSFKE